MEARAGTRCRRVEAEEEEGGAMRGEWKHRPKREKVEEAERGKWKLLASHVPSYHSLICHHCTRHSKEGVRRDEGRDTRQVRYIGRGIGSRRDR